MSKKYNKKSIKNSSIEKKTKLSLKEKRKVKKDKQKRAVFTAHFFYFLKFHLIE